MSVIKYKYNDATKLSEHFCVKNFRCKCGKTHEILIDSNLVQLLEKLIVKLNAKSCTVYSAHRCSAHDKKVGGSGKGSHVEGKAVDCYFIGQDNKRIPSKKVCLTLEDMGHKNGIGYRCGGGKDASGQTHIDVKTRKWYGDESKSKSKACCSSFYNYFGLKKETAPKPTQVTSKPQTTATSKTITYVVKKGDTLSKIAQKYKTTWQKIYNDNKKVIGKNPNIIKVGQKLTIK